MIYEIAMTTGVRFFTTTRPLIGQTVEHVHVVQDRAANTAARALARGEAKTAHLNGNHVAYILEHVVE